MPDRVSLYSCLYTYFTRKDSEFEAYLIKIRFHQGMILSIPPTLVQFQVAILLPLSPERRLSRFVFGLSIRVGIKRLQDDS
ncbi:hypothetical protein Tco_0857689 [Tanacetum coccineum]|uniref:Uncharacterized protein n=1 Tax=Tanacetum coccineum TaxID=301880 RepID=A0ABQ5BAB1_9ASTR